MSDAVKETTSATSSRERRRSRYERPRRYISWVVLIFGIAVGLGSGMFYAWNVDPVEEVNVAPWQLNTGDRNAYVVAIMLQYNLDGNLANAIQRLVDLKLPGNDPIQAVANIACDLARTGYVDSASGVRAVRSMMDFYQGQGKSGCADNLIPADVENIPEVVQVDLPTSTPQPPASKTPTPPGTFQPTETPPPALTPSATPQRAFNVLRVSSFCDLNNAGVIEVRVVDFNGQEIPGQPILVRWNGGESRFFTGLKPERGRGYADFDMEPDTSYVVEMPGLSDPTAPLLADRCTVEGGDQTTTSYQVYFRES